MKLTLEQITSEGVQLAFTGKQHDWLSRILTRLSEAGREIRAEVEVSVVGRTIHVKGAGHAALSTPCARCLQEVATTVDPEFTITLLPVQHAEEVDPNEQELGEEELDEHTYDGRQIDLADIINEQFMLAQPYRVLCKDDCAGLCPSCGADLNESDCECKKASGHPAFAALADIKIED